jgi:ribosomal protein L11 methyltransferase
MPGPTDFAAESAVKSVARFVPGTKASTQEGSVLACIPTDAATAIRLSDRLAETFEPEAAAVAAYTEPTGDWVVEIHFAVPPDRDAVRALVGDLAGVAAARKIIFASIATRDWVAASLAGLAPVEAGRFFLHGAHDRASVPDNRIGIEIEAALAFGSGHHGTTRGCLLALDRHIRRARPGKALDIGTGSGVLAIAAARAGWCVVAGDIDPTSVAAAQRNARFNRAGSHIAIVRANGTADRRIEAGAPYDLVFANILLAPVRRLARPIRALVAPGGRVILSGLLAQEANAALAAYRAVGLRLEQRRVLDGWATLVLARPTARRVRQPRRIRA